MLPRDCHARTDARVLSFCSSLLANLPVTYYYPADDLFTMDFSQMNPAEQAHMTRVIERKQVRISLNCCGERTLNTVTRCLQYGWVDARLHAHVLGPR